MLICGCFCFSLLNQFSIRVVIVSIVTSLFLPLLLETVATDEEDAETRAERGVKFLKKLEVLCFGFGTRYSTSLMKRRKRGEVLVLVKWKQQPAFEQKIQRLKFYKNMYQAEI